MVKKLSILLMICILLAVSFLGCGSDPSTAPQSTQSNNPSQTEAPPDNTCPKSVMIDGKIYHDWNYLRSDIHIEDDQILGYITSVVHIYTMPQQNNEANYSTAMDAPYARWIDEEYGEVYVIKVNRKWYILLPADYPID